MSPEDLTKDIFKQTFVCGVLNSSEGLSIAEVQSPKSDLT